MKKKLKTSFFFILTIYAGTLSVLSFLVFINGMIGYQPTNLFGTEISLEDMILIFMPGNNPFHLQKLYSAPLLYSIMAGVFAIGTCLMLKSDKRENNE